jgi:pathogenicity locus Cdd1 protein
MIKTKKFQLTKFQAIPGVGKSIAQDFVDLGYGEVDELRTEDPEEMYQNLIVLRGHHIDRCVFRCANYFASNSVHDPELLKWWNWKDKK